MASALLAMAVPSLRRALLSAVSRPRIIVPESEEGFPLVVSSWAQEKKKSVGSRLFWKFIWLYKNCCLRGLVLKEVCSFLSYLGLGAKGQGEMGFFMFKQVIGGTKVADRRVTSFRWSLPLCKRVLVIGSLLGTKHWLLRKEQIELLRGGEGGASWLFSSKMGAFFSAFPTTKTVSPGLGSWLL